MKKTIWISLGILFIIGILGIVKLYITYGDQGIQISKKSTNTHTVQNTALTQSKKLDDISILLGRTTNTEITYNLISNSDVDGFIQYGLSKGMYGSGTANFILKSGIPTEIVINNLKGNTEYYYKIQYKNKGSIIYKETNESNFHTARSSGEDFVFTVEADPHLDEQSDPEIYKKTLQNILNDNPDFLIDLGDIFMSDKLPIKTYQTIEEKHILFRGVFDYLQGSVPLYLVLGNHEGEAGWEQKGGENNIANWATNIRKLYYPNPLPNQFYSGDIEKQTVVGLRESYYSFLRGDALIVVIDPYRNTVTKPNQNGWDWTLGKTQYDWLKNTLTTSTAKYKFVFSHQLVGGGSEGRGGIEFAKLYERGGNNLDGTYGFDKYRAGWGKPIHQILVENNVDIFFHGHDHFFAKQELDGIVYQLVPQPSHPGDKINTATKYGYTNGTIIGGSGYLRVTVSTSGTKIEFVKYDDTILYTYIIH